MMKVGRGKKIATIAAVGAMAVTGTAMAAGGGPGGVLGGGSEQLAEDLAAELDGVNPNEVEQALESVQEQKMEERRANQAENIAAELDGVGVEQVADALAVHEEQIRGSIEIGERPEEGSLVKTLAEELDLSEDEVTTALESARESAMESHQAEALERLDEAVTSGDVTEEQADQIRERIESGAGGPGGPGGPAPEGSAEDASSGTFEVAPPATA